MRRSRFSVLPLAEVLLVRSALDGLARRDRVEPEELEDPAQDALGVADELLVREDVRPAEVGTVGFEESRGSGASARTGGRSGGSRATLRSGSRPEWGGGR